MNTTNWGNYNWTTSVNMECEWYPVVSFYSNQSKNTCRSSTINLNKIKCNLFILAHAVMTMRGEDRAFLFGLFRLFFNQRGFSVAVLQTIFFKLYEQSTKHIGIVHGELYLFWSLLFIITLSKIAVRSSETSNDNMFKAASIVLLLWSSDFAPPLIGKEDYIKILQTLNYFKPTYTWIWTFFVIFLLLETQTSSHDVGRQVFLTYLRKIGASISCYENFLIL